MLPLVSGAIRTSLLANAQMWFRALIFCVHWYLHVPRTTRYLKFLRRWKLRSGGNALLTEVKSPSDNALFGWEEIGGGQKVCRANRHSGLCWARADFRDNLLSAPSGVECRTRVCSTEISTAGSKREASLRQHVAAPRTEGRSGFSQNLSARVRGLWCVLLWNSI